jgi:CRISPR-associated endoribonuclease Cas6
MSDTELEFAGLWGRRLAGRPVAGAHLMPATLLITLQLDTPAPEGPHTPLQAVTYQLIGHASSVEGRRLHQTQLNPLSQHLARVAGFGGVLGHDRRTLQLRLNTLNDALVPLLQDAFAPGLPLPETHRALLRGQVVGQVTTVEEYSTLMDSEAACGAGLTFLTPTALRSGNQFHDRPRAAWIYHGLLRRWNAFAPQALPAEAWTVLTDDLRAEREEIRTHSLAVPGSARQERLQAFTGTLQLGLNGTRARHLLGMLTRFAPYAGIGAKTMYGFGAVQTSVFVDQAEQPPPARAVSST